MLAGHALFRYPVFNTALRRHRLRDEGRIPQQTRNRVTSHQFYAVPGNNLGKLIFRLS
jgi:hypothetical protein